MESLNLSHSSIYIDDSSDDEDCKIVQVDTDPVIISDSETEIGEVDSITISDEEIIDSEEVRTKTNATLNEKHNICERIRRESQASSSNIEKKVCNLRSYNSKKDALLSNFVTKEITEDMKQRKKSSNSCRDIREDEREPTLACKANIGPTSTKSKSVKNVVNTYNLRTYKRTTHESVSGLVSNIQEDRLQQPSSSTFKQGCDCANSRNVQKDVNTFSRFQKFKCAKFTEPRTKVRH